MGFGKLRNDIMSGSSAKNNQEKVRLDQLLVDRGLVESREKARRLILAGQVLVGDNQTVKAGTRVPCEAALLVKTPEKFVSRGGVKLEGALDFFGVDPAGLVCLDLGASTGGFTDSLLQRGAVRVYAFDVGQNQLHWRIRQDPRVVVREGVNVRNLIANDLPEPISLAVADLSFISLTLILPPVFALLPAKADMLVLIKPQFELARGEVPRGGVVRDEALHQKAVEKIRAFVTGPLGVEWLGVTPSPILGTKGNVEFLAHLRKP